MIMMRLIDASELTHRICNGFISHDGYVDGEFVDVFKDNGFDLFANNGNNEYMRFMNEVVRIVESVPEADAEPVRHGAWIDAMCIDMPVQVCSLCNTFFPLEYTGGGHHYCPNCGAKMDEEVEKIDG